jgi:hypothetical protein
MFSGNKYSLVFLFVEMDMGSDPDRQALHVDPDADQDLPK